MRGGGGVSKISVENFLSHSAEKCRRGTLLCFRKFLVLKNVRDKRGGGYHDFLSKLFCFTVPKNAVGEPFSLSLISGMEEVRMRGWGGWVVGGVKIFRLTVPKNFVGQPFRVSLISGIEKFYASEGYVTIFCRIFFVSQCRKIS